MGAQVWAPTADQILDLRDVHRRADRFRFELCDRDLRPIGELHPDRDQSVPSIENDATANTSRRLRGLRLLPDEATDVNTIRDRLRVYMVLQNGAEYRLGTFLWADANRPRRSWGDQHDAELVDFTYILDQQVTQAYGFGAGSNIGYILIFLFMRAGFELDQFADLGRASDITLTDPMSWQPGVRWLQMFTDLGDIVGFAPPWFDRDGRMHHNHPPDPEINMATVPAYEDGTRVLADSIVYSDDLIAAPNDFAVFDSGTDRLTIGRYQVPASAPHSFANRGFRIGLTESVQGLVSQAQGDQSAEALSRSRGRAFEWLSFSSFADPRHDTWDVVPAFAARWLETNWKLELRSGGLMTHTMKRTSYAP